MREIRDGRMIEEIGSLAGSVSSSLSITCPPAAESSSSTSLAAPPFEVGEDLLESWPYVGGDFCLWDDADPFFF